MSAIKNIFVAETKDELQQKIDNFITQNKPVNYKVIYHNTPFVSQFGVTYFVAHVET